MWRRYSRHGERADIDAVDEDGPFGDVVEAADEIHEGGLARAAGAHQADHLAGPNVQVHVFEHGPGAVVEAHAAELDFAPQPLGMHGAGRLGHARHAVEDGENPLGAGPRPLHGRHHAAHRIHAAVEAADVSRRRADQHADGDVVLKHLPRAEAPDHQQSHRGQQAHDRPKKRPDGVHAVVGLKHAIVGRAEALDFALLLGKGLDHADAGNRVGQHAGHFAPGPRAQGETAPQTVAHPMYQLGDERQAAAASPGPAAGRCDSRIAAVMHDHQNVVGEIEQVDRQESSRSGRCRC